jgi:hypothetical protein
MLSVKKLFSKHLHMTFAAGRILRREKDQIIITFLGSFMFWCEKKDEAATLCLPS